VEPPEFRARIPRTSRTTAEIRTRRRVILKSAKPAKPMVRKEKKRKGKKKTREAKDEGRKEGGRCVERKREKERV